MSPAFSFFLDIGLVALLSGTIFLCVKLNRQLQSIRDSKSEMAELINQFGEATTTAQESINELKLSAKRLSDMLETKVNRANSAVDDLTFMIEKANKYAGSIESTLGARRVEPSKKNESAVGKALKGAEVIARGTISPAAEKDASSSKSASRSEAEKELMEALKSIR